IPPGNMSVVLAQWYDPNLKPAVHPVGAAHPVFDLVWKAGRHGGLPCVHHPRQIVRMDGAGSVPRLSFVEAAPDILARLTVDVLSLALGRHGRDQGRNRVDDQSIPRLATVEDSLGARAPIPIVRRDSASPNPFTACVRRSAELVHGKHSRENDARRKLGNVKVHPFAAQTTSKLSLSSSRGRAIARICCRIVESNSVSLQSSLSASTTAALLVRSRFISNLLESDCISAEAPRSTRRRGRGVRSIERLRN